MIKEKMEARSFQARCLSYSRPLSRQRFTLIELLVAMAIFSIIMIILATMLHSTFLVIRKRNQRAKLAQTEQVVGDLLRRDFRNMVAGDEVGEEIRYNLAVDSATFITNSGIGVRISDVNPSESCRSPLTKVHYHLDGDILYREMIACVDSNKSDFLSGLPSSWLFVSQKDVVAENISSFKIASDVFEDTQLPEIVTITIKFKDERDSDHNTGGTAAYRTFVTRIFVNQRNQL